MKDLKHLDISSPPDVDSLSVNIEDYVSFEKLAWLNSQSEVGINVCISLCFSKCCDLRLVNYISAVKQLKINPSFEFPLETLEELNEMCDLVSLEIGDFTKKNITFSSLTNINSLSKFRFSVGVNTPDQYNFINKQKSLKQLHVKSLDLKLMTENLNLEFLRLDGTLKNEQIINTKLPNLKKIHLHNASLYKNIAFLSELHHLQSISVYNTNKLDSFPLIQNPENIKSLSLYNWPSLENIDEILKFSNLESLAIIVSPLKKLKLTIEDFERLSMLTNLKTVHTDFGKISDQEYYRIQQIYDKNHWENRAF